MPDYTKDEISCNVLYRGNTELPRLLTAFICSWKQTGLEAEVKKMCKRYKQLLNTLAMNFFYAVIFADAVFGSRRHYGWCP